MYYNFLSFVIQFGGYPDGIQQWDDPEGTGAYSHLLSCCQVLEFLKKRFSHNTLYDHSSSGKWQGSEADASASLGEDVRAGSCLENFINITPYNSIM